MWNLILEFFRFIADGKPRVVSMENVLSLRKKEIYFTFKDGLRKLSYQVNDGIVQCEYFGVPQRRRRLVLLASLLDEMSLPEKILSKPITVREPIGHQNSLNNDTGNTTDPCMSTRSYLHSI